MGVPVKKSQVGGKGCLKFGVRRKLKTESKIIH